jgi:large subunit ribosomal protein L6
MSRIGKASVDLPAGVEVKLSSDNIVTVKGPKGVLTQKLADTITLEVNDGKVELGRSNESKQTVAFHGLYRSLVNNMVTGVSKGYEKQLELVGVGYRATNTGQQLELSLGFSHNLVFELPKEIEVSTETLRGKNPIITLKSNDKQLIGQVCAKIRAFRTPEPYKGKGIRFVGEIIRRKAGKSAGKKK